jgi:hypothetical protein
VQAAIITIHGGVLRVVLGDQTIESLLGELDGFPAIPEPPRRHAIGGQVVGAQLRGLLSAAEVVVGSAPVTARVRISRGNEFVTVCRHVDRSNGIARRPMCWPK